MIRLPRRRIDAPTTARIGTYRPMGRSHFSFDGERKVCKRKPAARRLQRRPTSLCAVGFGLREPNGWTPRINSGHPIPALRPEQSDHVPWADCPQGLSSSTGCPVSHSSLPVALLASHPPCGSLWAAPKAPLGPRFPSGQFAALTRRKKASIAHFDGGARNVARNGVGQLSPAFGVRSCSPFPPSKWAGLFPSAAYRRSAPPQLALTRLNQCKLGCYIVAWRTSQRRKQACFFFCG